MTLERLMAMLEARLGEAIIEALRQAGLRPTSLDLHLLSTERPIAPMEGSEVKKPRPYKVIIERDVPCRMIEIAVITRVAERDLWTCEQARCDEE